MAKVLELQLQHHPFSECSELISIRIDWFDHLTVQGTVKSLVQHHSSKASILRLWLHNPCFCGLSQSSVVPFSSCRQSSPASGSSPMSQLFISDGQSIGASASASVLPMNIQDWLPLGLTGLISLQSVNSSSSQKTLGIQIIHTYCLYVYFKYFPDRSRPRYFLWHFKELYHFYVLKFLIHLLIFC